MKKYIPAAVVLFAVIILVSCEKSASTSIEGKWNVISDSTIISGSSTSYDVYHGGDADYFNFQNGVLHTKEASELDTFSYQLITADTINLTQTGALIYRVPQTGTYTFTGNQFRINVRPNVTNPGFSFQRIIDLKR